jgi:hypothetical protein
VHFLENDTYRYLSGERKPISIRIDTGLYSAFKPLSKRVYGSTCKAVEVYMVGFIETIEKGVYISNTPQPIKIEKIVIERNFKERRRLEIERELDEKVILSCGVVNCRNEAVAKAVWLSRNEEYWLCSEHLRTAKLNPRLWKLI